MSRRQSDAYSPQRLTAQQVHSRKAQRRRKRKLRQLRFILVLFMLASIITLSLTVFFKIDTIKVTGTTRYSYEEIVSKSGLTTGSNLFLYKIGGFEDAIQEQFIYIEKAEIKKHLPGTLEIVITEAREVCTIESNGGYYVLSNGGKVLEKTTDERDDLYNVRGIDMSAYSVGDTLENESAESIATLSEVTRAISEVGLNNITLLDLTDIYNINITYDDRITIKCGTQVELAYKLKYAKAILGDKIQPNERGTLDVSYAHTSENAVFSPSREEILPTSSETSSEEATEE